MIKSVEIALNGQILQIETGRMGRQASGSVTVRNGDTVVFVSVVEGPDKRDLGFFPLYVDYREKTYAAGKIPGGFFKREGRPTTKEILTARLIDRPHRPLFPKGYFRDVNISALVLSADQENDPDVLAMIGASAALHLASVPCDGPTGSIRIGRIDDQFVINPTSQQLLESTLDLVVAATRENLLMVEASAWELPEDLMLEALDLAHGEIRKIIDGIEQLGREVGRAEPPAVESADEAFIALVAEIRAAWYDKYYEANQTPGKMTRKEAVSAITTGIKESYAERVEAGEFTGKTISAACDEVLHEAIRTLILTEDKRSDGRRFDEIRNISCDVDFLPRAHGSCLFTRGETQALVAITLGSTFDEQKIDGLIEAYNKKFYLHYNFPSFSVGESWPNRGPKRREIGHGMLAERSLAAVLPDFSDFPYTIRVVSDIMESNGSSSMASVCGGTLAMMDGGVPIKRPVAGIAMGLVAEGDKIAVLSDIAGLEDHHGDMDFKVAGTQVGITALQMDIKIGGISREIMSAALEQARAGRVEILRIMLGTLRAPRADVSPYAPRLVQLPIANDKIGNLIGPGGRNIRKIQEDTSTIIEINDAEGYVTISGYGRELIERAVEVVRAYIEDVEIGKIYKSRVVSVKDFGAFLELVPGQEGFCHVSELAEGFVKNTAQVCSVGDVVEVKVLDIDENGRIRVSKRAADRDLGRAPEPIPAGAEDGENGRGGRDSREGRDSRGGGRRRRGR